jgi:endonuclease YncB( thermonuclease family)
LDQTILEGTSDAASNYLASTAGDRRHRNGDEALANLHPAQDAIAQTQQGSKQAQSQVAQLVPGSIYDGDTLRVNLNGVETRIRLCGIDAPERDQPLGIAARDHLRSLINRGNGSIVVVPVEQDQYGRTVAELYVQPRSGQGYQAGEEIAVNAQMVADGYAYHYAQYSGDCPNGGLLAAIESQAQQQGVESGAIPTQCGLGTIAAVVSYSELSPIQYEMLC